MYFSERRPLFCVFVFNNRVLLIFVINIRYLITIYSLNRFWWLFPKILHFEKKLTHKFPIFDYLTCNVQTVVCLQKWNFSTISEIRVAYFPLIINIFHGERNPLSNIFWQFDLKWNRPGIFFNLYFRIKWYILNRLLLLPSSKNFQPLSLIIGEGATMALLK